jgi:hypothetical protein
MVIEPPYYNCAKTEKRAKMLQKNNRYVELNNKKEPGTLSGYFD